MGIATRTLRQILTSRLAAPFFRPLMRTRASIFMLHRFEMPDLGVHGDDPVALRQSLALLKRDGYDFVSLETLFADLRQGRARNRPAVAFTIDDGYVDQAHVAAPVFAEFDCPVTTFVTSGYLDRQLWFWWDRIEYVFDHTPRKQLATTLGETPLAYAWADVAERKRAQADFTARCKEVPDAVKHEAIATVASAAQVELPDAAPAKYAPMSWDELRKAEQGGMSFGPHTVTHPILARTTDEQSAYELTESWRRLKAEASRPVAVFCYPNGRSVDFSDREIGTLRELGFAGAVTGEWGYAERLDVTTGRATPDPFRVNRFGYTDDPGTLLQIVSGVERMNQLLRS
jgi:peptidoglycan/xylan/chitin deacetylase (PgdA/CDA1 family)